MSAFSRYDPRIRPYFEYLFRVIQHYDPSARVTSTVRSSSEQARLYRLFLAGQSRYPVARPGTSKHEHGRAIDIVARPEVLRGVGAWWESIGGRWGGRFDDDIHFEV